MTGCSKCGKKMIETTIEYFLEREKITIHDVPGLKCPKCGHITMNTHHAEHFYKILERIRGSPKGLHLHRALSSDGKNLILRFPKDIERMLGLTAKDQLDIWVDGSRIVVEKVGS